MPRIDLIQLRRGTEAALLAEDPILALAEPGFITDTYEIIVGDGVSLASTLDRIGVGGGGGGGDIATDTIWNVAGDTVYGTGSNTAARLGVGAALSVYCVNAGATAPEWVASSGTGSVARVVSPAFTTPNIGTATGSVSGSSGSCTGNAASASTAALAALVNVVDTASATCRIAMFEGATGSQECKTDGGLTYNASTGMLTATGLTGPLTGNASGSSGSCSGNAATATLAATVTVVDSTSATCWVAIFDAQTGSLAVKTDGGLSYAATTGILTAAGFSGPLTGNVTGNASGSSGSCTGNAATSTNATDHIADTTAAHAASAIAFTPTGTIAATDVQAAIAEVASEAGGGGYTNLTQFVGQTAWRVFYSNTDGDVVELALGANGTYLKSNGAAAAPTFEAPAGAGTVTATGGALTANAIVLGNGTTDTKVVAGIKTNGTAQVELGVAATTLGSVKMHGSTSGDVTIQPNAVAGTAVVLTAPATTGTIALTWTDTIRTTDADLAAAVNTWYHWDISGLTADRTLTLPATAAVGDRVALTITTGDDLYEVLITATAGDTLNAVAGGTEWSRLFITNEVLILRCIVANTTWIVEYDGRIPCMCQVMLTADSAAVTGGVSTPWATLDNNGSTEQYDVGSVMDTDGLFTARRAGTYNALASIGSAANTTYAGVVFYKNPAGANTLVMYTVAFSSSALLRMQGSRVLAFVADDKLQYNGIFATAVAAEGNSEYTYYSVEEIL